MDADVEVLAEALDDAGYATAAFVTNCFMTRRMGFSRGFDLFSHAGDNRPHQLFFTGIPQQHYLDSQDGRIIVDRAVEWLSRAPNHGFFLWIHLLEPHAPYLHTADREVALLDNEAVTTEALRERKRQAYREEVVYTDEQILRLLDVLDTVVKNGLVVMVADHGEEFWEHGQYWHGKAHHTETIDVNIAVAGAGVHAGASRGGVASLVDVTPTLRAAAGLSAGGAALLMRRAVTPPLEAR